MKKLVILCSVMLMSGLANASCMGPICWDDQGLYLAGTIMDGNGTGTPSMTAAQINAASPRAAGQEIYCSNCTQAKICVSTGTGAGAYQVLQATAPAAASIPHCS
jgi:hypothetical protein